MKFYFKVPAVFIMIIWSFSAEPISKLPEILHPESVEANRVSTVNTNKLVLSPYFKTTQKGSNNSTEDTQSQYPLRVSESLSSVIALSGTQTTTSVGYAIVSEYELNEIKPRKEFQSQVTYQIDKSNQDNLPSSSILGKSI